MVQLALALVAAALVSVQASPLLEKRINQNIVEATAKWEAACQSATQPGSPDFLNCNPLSVAAFSTLLANAGDCDQQNAADKLVDFSKQLKSQEMVTLAQIFAQQPRNSPNSFSIPYCQQAPRNAELNGLFHCQFAGVKPVFVGNLNVPATGTVPLNSKPVSPPGSCPANPSGPITDGKQLSDITTEPFASGSSSTQPARAVAPPASSVSPSDSSVTPSGSSGTAAGPESDSCPAPATESPTPTMTPSTSSASKQSNVRLAPNPMSTTSITAPAATSPSSGFQTKNGQDAQKLNAQYATLTADSSCDAGNFACVGGQFAQCVGGKFVLEPCAATLSCYALPLINSAGTSTTCTTEADAKQRIANSGATGGITG